MSMFLESPVPILVVGILLEAVLAGLLVITRRGYLLWAILAVLLLTVAGLIAERLTITESKRVKQTLYSVAEAIEANSLDRLRQYVAPSATATLNQAAYYLRSVHFNEVRLRNMEVTINKLTSPPSAEARFFATASFEDRSGQIPYRNYGESLIVQLRLINGRWLITEHVEIDPNGFGHQGQR